MILFTKKLIFFLTLFTCFSMQFVFLSPHSSQAISTRISLTELLQLTDHALIVTEVEERIERAKGGFIYTTHKFTVENDVLNTFEGNIFSLRQLGGKIGKEATVNAYAPSFKKGHRYALLLKQLNEQAVASGYPHGIVGVFEIVKVDELELVVLDRSEFSGQKPLRKSSTMGLLKFIELVRATRG